MSDASRALKALHDEIYYSDDIPADRPLTAYRLCEVLRRAVDYIEAREGQSEERV